MTQLYPDDCDRRIPAFSHRNVQLVFINQLTQLTSDFMVSVNNSWRLGALTRDGNEIFNRVAFCCFNVAVV